MNREDEISQIAYQIWEAENCFDGHAVEHWLKAEAMWEEKQKKEAESDNKDLVAKHIIFKGKKMRAHNKKP